MKMYDVIVIGFGKAGKTLAGQLGKQGKKVALIEKDNGMYGGTCINVGCIPSKRLITEAATAPTSDFASKAAYYKKAVEGKRELTGALNKANYNKLIQAGVEVIDGMASFVDATHVEVKTKDGVLQLEGKQFVINTGATSVIPGIPGVKDSDKVYTSESMMDLDELPEKLTIVGGGYIGLEFAAMYANFGSKVTVVQDIDVFLPREDKDIADNIRSVLEAKGIEIVTGAKTTKIEGATLYYTVGDTDTVLEGDAILMATGRRPNTDGLEAQKAGIALSDRGAVVTDEHLRTNVPNIWAAGDVCGNLQFTYISLDDSRIIMSDMSGKGDRTTQNRGAFSYSVFIDPPFSRVGLSESEAKAKNIEYRVMNLPAAAIPKAKVLRKPEGVLKALVGADDQILGVQLFCAESHEMINLVKMAMDNNLKYQVLRDFIYTHPTMSESLNDLFAF
ncbi:MAG: FAD-dependent oxidoreductase [Megasphaera massiliensis]|jgi:pyruvate/2-oxoglutarate dehydrogenase complex dihydrolipoamide dehydrogenase (E3) component|uniref:FAD-dependent oxidoreductase n=1 Tax=Megasphaera massiliensis TaxID=1232428 RepID=UPI002A756470|nr:FAD-dependent oxidoreductase [Megasphaera massiliensis]MDY2966148.1 FAD-dependent oxidoreductase [Megasphaera massiliensis]